MTFVGINDVWIQADMRENNLAHIQPGDVVDIALDVQPGRIIKGKVRSIGSGVDTGTSTALGSLPTIENDRNWLREAQRFPVIIEVDGAGIEAFGLRVGAQASLPRKGAEAPVGRRGPESPAATDTTGRGRAPDDGARASWQPR